MVLLQTLYRTTSVAAFVAGGDPSAVINWDFLQSQSLTSFSRTSNATLFDSTGKLTYAANNLALYSEQFDTTAWTGYGTAGITVTANNTTAPDGTMTADRAVTTSAAGAARLRQTISPLKSATIIFSAWVKSDSTGYFKIWGYDGVSDFASSFQQVGTTWTRIYCIGTTSASATSDFGFLVALRDSGNTAYATGTWYIWGAQIEQVTYETSPRTYNATTSTPYYGPRYPYAYNGSTWDAQGLLVEAQSINTQTYSSRLSGWSMYQGTPTLDAATSPEGVSNAVSVVESTANGLHQFYSGNTFTTASGTVYTFSIFAKANGRTRCQINCQSNMLNPTPVAFYDLSTTAGSVDNVDAGVVASIQNVGNGWYRLTYTFTANANSGGNGNMYINLVSTGTTVSYAGNASLGMYFYGAQFEASDRATSYIPNLSTGTTTRNADTSLAFSAITLPTGLSFSRTSNAMQYDAAGRLTYAPNNLVLYSDTLTNAVWTNSTATITADTGPDGTAKNKLVGVTALTPGSGTGSKAFYQAGSNPTINNGAANVLGAVDVYTTSSITVQVSVYSWGGAEVFSYQTLAANTWTTLYVVLPATSLTGYAGIAIYCGSNTIYTKDVRLSAVTYETVPRPCDQVITTTTAYYGPRYDYDPTTRLPKGLLIEEGRTNIALSAFTSTNWTTGQSTKDSTIAGPDAVSGGAQTIKAVAGNNYHMLYSTAAISVSANTDYTYSLYAKAGTSRYVNLNIFGNSANHYISAVFDIGDTSLTARTEQSVGTSSGTIAGTKQEYLGNGWFRLSLTGKTSQTTVYLEACIASSKTGNTFNGAGEVTFNAAGTETISLFGAQLEAGSFPTSYIPNPGIASGIRSADIATLTGTALTTLQGSAFTAVAEGTISASGNDAPEFWATSPISVGKFVSAGFDNSTSFGGAAGPFLGWYAAEIKPTTGANTNDTTVWRVAAGVATTGSVSASANGSSTATSGSSDFTGSITGANLGSRGSAKFMNGHMRRFASYNVRLSDAKLQTKSVVGATL